jgi:hypothetical protein
MVCGHACGSCAYLWFVVVPVAHGRTRGSWFNLLRMDVVRARTLVRGVESLFIGLVICPSLDT